MSKLIKSYPVFESSQVLTSSQLNQVTAYLDQQSRLTRAKLIGMGIVCGLKLSFDDSGGSPQITISKGTAVTSEGFLITLGSCTTSWVRPYKLPEGVKYAPFDNADPAITLYELLREMPEDDTDVVPLDDEPGFLDDKFVLLFLEIFDNDLKSCLGNTCDDLGIDRIFTVRKLLISKDDLDELLEHSSNAGNLYPDKFELTEVVMPRTLFDAEADHSRDYTAFSEHYVESIQPIFEALLGNGEPGLLHETYSVYDLLLGSVYDFQNPFDTPDVAGLKNQWSDYLSNSSGSVPGYSGIQYFSRFMKDLILAYNEFKDCAFELMSECCPDMSRFPKHVMLGRAVVPNETPEEASKYRHGFVQPPIYNHQKELLEKAISLHKRLVLMVRTFNLDRIENTNGEESQQLRITPSDEKNTILSHRSIPYYYDIKSEITGIEGTLEQHWSYDITRKKGPGTMPVILGYENQADDQSSAISALETPLFYDLDSFPFLRVEGHLGQNIEAVMDQINTLKHRFDLPFHSLSVQLDPDANLLSPDYNCGFEDLQEEYASAHLTYCGFIRDLMNLLLFANDNQGVLFDNDEETSADLKQIVDILNSLRSLCELLPNCLDQFDLTAFQQQYKNSLEQILHFLLVEKRLLDEINVDEEDPSEELPVINGLIQHISPLIFRFTDLLFYNTFLRIYAAFKRREYYLQQQTNVFSSYIRENPGVQHQAGVQKGGTFIVVYQDSEDPTVIADFALPYLCCDSGRCVPMCDVGDDYEPEISPFARPDYAITTMGTPVEINVAINDYGFLQNTLSVESESESENGGNIHQISEEGLIRYTPLEEFTGYDRFSYRLTDTESGLSDTGRVTILVKEPRQVTECYSTEILSCWGIQQVRSALRNRGIDPSSMSFAEMVQVLLDSLRETNGFTLDEIRFNSLEDGQSRRDLLSCIGINHEGSSYEQLEELILNYQSENCGGQVEEPVTGCYSADILRCWARGNLEMLIEFYNRRNPNEPISGGDEAQVLNALLESLRSTGGFTDDEIDSMNPLEDPEQRRQLLRCINPNLPVEDMEWDELGERIRQYQHENCGGRIERDNIPRVELSIEHVSNREIRRVLSSRGREVSSDVSRETLEEELTRTSRGLSFTKAEVMIFTREEISRSLQDRGINPPGGANKSQLIDLLFER